MTLLLPLYAHPAEDPRAWRPAPLRNAGATVIVNVHDGPGEALDPAYQEVTADLQTAGVAMLGYVDLDYGRRPFEQVTADVAAWRRYPVGGIFFDQAPSAVSGLSAVSRAVSCVRDGHVVLNPGTRPHPAYSPLAERICTFEGPWQAYLDDGREPDWPHALHLVYGVPPRLLGEAALRMSRRCAGGLVSDLTAPLPYLGLPGWLRLPVTASSATQAAR